MFGSISTVIPLKIFNPDDFDLTPFSWELTQLLGEFSLAEDREVIAACVEYFAKPRTRGEGTISTYLRCLATQEKLGKDYQSYPNKRSYEVHRSAALYNAYAELYQALFWACQYSGGHLGPNSGIDITELQMGILVPLGEVQMIRYDKPPSRGERFVDKDLYLLSVLERGWHTQVWEKAALHPTYGPAVAVLSLVGCRPAEFGGDGVFVTKDTEGNLLLRIRGKKVRRGAGQPWRVAKIKGNATTCSRYLLSLIERSGRRGIYVKLSCIDMLTDFIAKTGQRLWPNLTENITAKTFRKMVASEMKAAGWSKARIAALLGHISVRTQKLYGKARFGGGNGFWVEEVIAPLAIKIDEVDAELAAEVVASRLKIRLIK